MSAIIKFAKRHKKKLIFTIIFFGGGYYGIKYSIRKLTESFLLNTNAAHMADEKFLAMKKHEHYLTIKQTSNDAIMALVKTMIDDEIRKQFPNDQLLEQLKTNPANKLEIWQKLKILSVAKSLTNMYAIALLVLFLKIELNIIGGYLFLSNSFTDFSSINLNNSIENTEDLIQQQELTLSASVQQRYLGNIDVFVKRGLPALMNSVLALTEEEFKNVSLKEHFSIELLSQKFENIRIKLEKNQKNNDSFATFYLLNDFNTHDFIFNEFENSPNESRNSKSSPKKFKSDDEILFDLNLETYDILNSKDCKLCINSLLNYFSNEILNNLTSSMVNQIIQNGMNQQEKIIVSLPFAKLIPIIERTHCIYETDTSILNNMLNNVNLGLFSANIYEAFSIKYTKASCFYDDLKPNSILNQLE